MSCLRVYLVWNEEDEFDGPRPAAGGPWVFETRKGAIDRVAELREDRPKDPMPFVGSIWPYRIEEVEVVP